MPQRVSEAPGTQRGDLGAWTYFREEEPLEHRLMDKWGAKLEEGTTRTTRVGLGEA